MPKLMELLAQNKLTLIVAVAGGDPDVLTGAVESGADVLCLSLAEGVTGVQKEKQALIRSLADVKVPVGLNLSGEKQLGEKELVELITVGFDFISLGMEFLSPALIKANGLAKILTLNSRFTLEEVVEISRSDFDALTAAILPSSDRGGELVVGDLQNYISIVLSSALPVIIPSQRSLKPSEVAILADTGAKALLLTSQVTGKTLEGLKKTVAEFRRAVDDLE